MDEFNIVICGVGGQGILTLSKILASAAVKCNYKVRVGETLGMSQRGGIVQSFVRFGRNVFSPLIPLGGANAIISLDYVESIRVINYTSSNSVVLLNSSSIQPISVALGEFSSPSLDDVKKAFNKITEKVYVLNAEEVALKFGLPAALNIFLLGAFCKLFPNVLPLKLVVETIMENVPSKYLNENISIFNAGLNFEQYRKT
ncbi:MAG: indolepyruvate oxidoreductase subunit beta [Candidatus Methanomethylicia archaeon]|nr:indolepyruvate oxidoreductase subunit beta [Candidatus Methanomethylicia archaeon]MCX8168932.1 indolepyruvate oxidoreductase subunit beta [Candidatus Methanomethylicia archaeon]MDW7988664.1 indolepyruvate oxidoreductase subunit beta [Nitrososphaerota archaeon]